MNDPNPGDTRTSLRDRLATAMGYHIVTCPGCGSWPCRTSWMRTCRRCGVLLCLVCLPERAPQCTACAVTEATP